MTDHAGNIVPLRFIFKLLPSSFQQEIIVNWLDMEVPQQAPLLGLGELRGWRNREVYVYIKAFDWTLVMFPQPVAYEHEHSSHKFAYLHQPRRHVPIVKRRSEHGLET